MKLIDSFVVLVRTALVITVVGFLAFGTFATPLFAGPQGQSSTAVANGDFAVYESESIGLYSHNHTSVAHDANDDNCGIGSCVTILGMSERLDVPTGRVTVIEPFYLAMVMRRNIVVFMRPPTPKI
jgi:hypothetical protein